jgi:outer membrane protein with beta-barrel domain
MRSASAGKYFVVISVIVLAASFGAPAMAGVRFGVEIGANVSSLRYVHLDAFPPTSNWDSGWRMSFTGGASLELPWRRQFSVVTGLRYVQQGNRVKFDYPGSPPLTGEFRIAQHYLAMPLLLAFRPFRSRRYFLAAGPEGALLLNGKLFTDYSSSGLGSSSESITHQLKRANLSLDAETGLEFPAGKHFGIVTLRYTHGLVDAQKKDDWGVSWKTRGVEGLVGMRW